MGFFAPDAVRVAVDALETFDKNGDSRLLGRTGMPPTRVSESRFLRSPAWAAVS